VRVRDRLDDREPEAGAVGVAVAAGGEPLEGLEGLEGLEEAVDLGCGDRRAGVGDGQDGAADAGAAGDVDPAGGLLAGSFGSWRIAGLRPADALSRDGEWLAVQGRTGHGKSTMLNLLGGLDRPTEGTIELDGTDLGALRETQLTRRRAEATGFIFQTFNLVPTLSAVENVEAALIPLPVSGAEELGAPA
jgi:hypothetical protein